MQAAPEKTYCASDCPWIFEGMKLAVEEEAQPKPLLWSKPLPPFRPVATGTKVALVLATLLKPEGVSKAEARKSHVYSALYAITYKHGIPIEQGPDGCCRAVLPPGVSPFG